MTKVSHFREFTILYKKEREGGYSGQCLEIPGAISQAETLKELKKNMIDAITLIVKSQKKALKEKTNNEMVIEVPIV